MGKPAGVHEVSLDEWELVMKVNLTAPLIMCKQFLPAMMERGWGRIINLSSLAGRTTAQVNGAAYMTSKAGILGLTRHMAAVMRGSASRSMRWRPAACAPHSPKKRRPK